jgi:NAD(P)-dependent dehydrogenase (short-subunit alcohol dehydrogenase family)
VRQRSVTAEIVPGHAMKNIYQGKVAVITGAGSGIGRALAVQLAGCGARLALSDVNTEALAETAKLCGGADVRTYKLDVSSREQVYAHADEVKRDFGTAHLLFNNAGVTLFATIAEATIEEIEWQVSINLWGVIYGTKAFLPLMLAQRDGHIVNISSVFGLVGGEGQGPYNITKFGVRGHTECLWRELQGTGVRATTVHPGGIKTSIGAKARWGVNAGAKTKELEPRIEKILITPPETCAGDILRGVARGKRRILTGNGARSIDLFSRLLPVRHAGVLKAIMGF